MTMQEILLITTGGSLLIGLIGLILGITANLKYKRLYRQYDYFMRGKDAETLEDYFVDLQQHVERLEDEQEKNQDMFRVLNENIKSAVQKIGMIRYNAFDGLGGNMSFALALLDYNNSGVIINSVHSREGCFLYIKDVDQGTTDVELGAEEKNALEEALGYGKKEKKVRPKKEQK